MTSKRITLITVLGTDLAEGKVEAAPAEALAVIQVRGDGGSHPGGGRESGQKWLDSGPEI